MLKRIAALCLTLCLLCPPAFALHANTPAPQDVPTDVLTPPPLIQNVLDIAYHEWEETQGAPLGQKNKYTKWRNNYEWGWCAGFITWCMLEAGVPQEEHSYFKAAQKASPDGIVHTEGIMHVKEAGLGKVWDGYTWMDRRTNVPQPGFLVLYGASWNDYIHIGLVYDVQPLGEGKYRLTTLEGNVGGKKNATVVKFIHDYDMNAPMQENLSVVPEAERTEEESNFLRYDIIHTKVDGKDAGYYATVFFMPWVPGDELNAATTPTPPPAN